MIRVYADMVADLFHYGHMRFLKKARTLGDHLLVGICAEDVLVSYKRRPNPYHGRACRFRGRMSLRRRVLPNAPLMIGRARIEKYDIDLVVHGDDYSKEQQEYYYKVPIDMGIFRTVAYTQHLNHRDHSSV